MVRLSATSRAIGHGVTGVLCALILIPMALVALTSFKPQPEVYSALPWPTEPTLDNFRRLFAVSFDVYLWNSFGTTILRVTGQVLVAILAAYAFARFEFRFRGLLFSLVLGALMIPHSLTMIPIYIMVVELGWFDSWAALIIPNLAFPFGVFLLRQHMMQFPKPLIDAARADGASHWTILWRIIVPNMGPAIAGLVIVAFIECWNEYFWPLLVTDSDHMRTIQIGIRRFLDSEGVDSFGPLMAGVTLASLPALLVFFVLQRRVMDTFVSSGIR
jgi:multiple sugar transport system permease protein/sn-glycerol 3-phosphate transport system permease protein